MEKYYTPEIEDFHVGYEYEIFIKATPNYHEVLDGVEKDTWIKEIFYPSTPYQSIVNRIYTKEIRVPYLTKEQIVSEGWLLEETINNEVYIFGKIVEPFTEHYDYKLGFTPHLTEGQNRLSIYSSVGGGLSGSFNGWCPSINELRTIQKLLKI